MTDTKVYPFDLEAAKNGAPVCLSNGKPARIVCFNKISFTDNAPIIALIKNDSGEERIEIFGSDGHSLTTLDLCMRKTIKQGYVHKNQIFPDMPKAKYQRADHKENYRLVTYEE